MDEIYCIIDASGSMQQQEKCQLSVNTTQALAIASKTSIYKDFPKIKARLWQDKLYPLKNFDQDLQGSASLEALQNWIEKKLEKESVIKILLFSDGGFYDTSALNSFNNWLQNHPNVLISVIGVGADKNQITLLQLATIGEAYNLGDVLVALSVLTEKPLTFAYGLSNELNRRMSAPSAPIDEEEDEW